MYSLPINLNFGKLIVGAKVAGLLCCFIFTNHLYAQLFTGTTLQFGWTGNIGIGDNSNSVNKLFVKGGGSDAALYAKNNSSNIYALGIKGESQNSTGVFGLSTGSTASYAYGVWGKTDDGKAGVRAESINGFGIYATSTNGSAVRGVGTTGVNGTSSASNGIGVYGGYTGSNGYAAKFVGKTRLEGKVELMDDLDMDRYQTFYFGAGDYTGLFYSTTSTMASPRAFDGAYFDGPVLYGYEGGTLGTKQSATDEKAVLTWNHNEQVFIAGATTTGVADPNDYSLFVEKGIATGKVKVDAALADYVFEEEYEFQTIEELDTFIQVNHHLPGVISAEEAAENGVELSSFTVSLQEKIEELALYIIDMNKRLKILEEENHILRNNQSQD
ncbi:MAG: hypothetical protein AAGI38_23790 [Bacteroidota bacterium]